MNDTFSFTLESPLTEEQINLITDAELEHTNRIWFDTPKGKHIEFVKAPQWIPCSERFPEAGQIVLITNKYGFVWIVKRIENGWSLPGEGWFTDEEEPDYVKAWMPLPKPYEERREEE